MTRLSPASLTINPTHGQSLIITEHTKEIHKSELHPGPYWFLWKAIIRRPPILVVGKCSQFDDNDILKIRKITLGQSPPSPQWQKSISQPTAHSSEKIKTSEVKSKFNKTPQK